MSGVDVVAVSGVLRQLLVRQGTPVVLYDEAERVEHAVGLAAAVALDGLLPAFLVAGESVWRSATDMRTGFELVIVADRKALLGFRVQAIRASCFTIVMLATMEAVAQVSRGGAIVASDLRALWSWVPELPAGASWPLVRPAPELRR